jgi:hypothetical protein
MIDWDMIPHNLKQTALGLLDQILQDRPHVCYEKVQLITD